MVIYLGSLVYLCCWEGGTLQTNITGMCRVLSISGPHWVCPRSQCVCFPCLQCLGSRLFSQELSEGGPGLYALPRSKSLRFKYSDSPQRCRLGWTCVLCPSQIRAAQVMRPLVTTAAATYRLPTAQFSGCTTGAPSQVDVDCPEPQEVLVSKKACLQICR